MDEYNKGYEKGFEQGIIKSQQLVKDNMKLICVAIYNTKDFQGNEKWVVDDSNLDKEHKKMLEDVLKKYLKNSYKYGNEKEIESIRKEEVKNDRYS